MGRMGSILISVIILHLLTDTAALVTRRSWGSKGNRGGSYIRGRLGRIFIHHTAGPRCYTQSSCSRIVRGIQNYHVNTRKWADIGYSFLVGQDGRVYEGRGWRRTGAHTYGYNSKSYGIALMGNFVSATPNRRSLNAVRSLLNSRGARLTLTSKYKILGHKDVGSTACPGTKLYNIIKRWSRYGK